MATTRFVYGATLEIDPRNLSEIAHCMPSLEQVFRTHYKSTARLVRALGVDADDVDDVVQSVFVVAHRRLSTLSDFAAVRPWLVGITRRVAKDYRRGRARARAREHLRVPREPAADAAEHVARRQAAALVESILAAMKDQWRIVFVLADIEGFTAPEIADLTGWKLPTVYTRLRRARQAFESSRVRSEQSQRREIDHG